MMTASMMRDRYNSNIVFEEESEKCICGYDLIKESDYINTQGQLVSIMICESCGAIEHWVNEIKLIENQ